MKGKFFWGSIGIACLVAVFSTQALSANIRPFTGLADSLTYSGTRNGIEYSIQSVFDQTSIPILTGWSGYDAISSQSSMAYWSGDPQNLDGLFRLRIEYAGWKDINSMGLYSHSNILNTLPIFTGPAGPNSISVIVWFTPTSGEILGSGGVNTLFSGFSMGDFGLYFQTPNDRFYSEDALNTTDNGNPHILAYQSTTQSYNWLFAFEDTRFSNGSDQDFNDMFVTAESLALVPEPGTMVLLGSGLIGLAGLSRKKYRI